MAKVVCPSCAQQLDPRHHKVTAGVTAAGAAAGAWVGSGVGIVAGPAVAIAGTIPGAVIGGALAFFGVTKFARCPGCKKVFRI